MGFIRRWFRNRPLRSLSRRGGRGVELDHAVRRAALAAAGTAPPVAEGSATPAARLAALLPGVRSLTVRWEDLQERPVCRSAFLDS